MDDGSFEQISMRERIIDLALYLAVERRGRFASRQDILNDVPGYERYDLSDEKDAAAFHRTFENDKKRLREQGFAIETSEDGQQYRLDTTRTFMSSLEFTPHEVARLRAVGSAMLQSPTFPFASDLRVALAKLIGGLEWGAGVESAPTAPVLQPVPSETAPSHDEHAMVNVLRGALAQRKNVEVVYQSPGKAPTVRTIRPYGDFSYGGAWYCVAFDELRGEVRTLRISRILDAKPNTRRASEPDYDIPEDFVVEAYRGLPFQYGDEDFEATFIIRPELIDLFEGVMAQRGTRVLRDDGSLVWTVPARDTAAAIAWCVEEGPGVVPSAPESLVAAYRTTLLETIAQGGGHGAS